jgi:hypothetical protein
MEFMLNEFPRNSRHVSRLSYKDVPIFLEEFDEREFIFGIKCVAYMSNLGRFLHRQWYPLAECVSGWMNILEVLESVTTGSGGGTRPRPLSAPRVLRMLSVCWPSRSSLCHSHRLA